MSQRITIPVATDTARLAQEIEDQLGYVMTGPSQVGHINRDVLYLYDNDADISGFAVLFDLPIVNTPLPVPDTVAIDPADLRALTLSTERSITHDARDEEINDLYAKYGI